MADLIHLDHPSPRGEALGDRKLAARRSSARSIVDRTRTLPEFRRGLHGDRTMIRGFQNGSSRKFEQPDRTGERPVDKGNARGGMEVAALQGHRRRLPVGEVSVRRPARPTRTPSQGVRRPRARTPLPESVSVNRGAVMLLSIN
jgi:hypothetical protein